MSGIKPEQLDPSPLIENAQAVSPPTGPNQGVFYVKTVAGRAEGFYKNDISQETQLTSGGAQIGLGEINDGSNVGNSGVGIYDGKTGTTLNFRKLIAGPNMTISVVENTVVFSSASGSGGGSGGEANTASNSSSGSGAGLIFKAKSGVDLIFRRIIAGSGITISTGTDDITINSTGGGGGSGEANTASNLGSGTGLVATKSGVNLPFKSLVAGSGIALSNDATTVTINATGGGGGEANTASNVGSGSPIFRSKTAVDLAFRSIIASAPLTITQGADDLTIAAPIALQAEAQAGTVNNKYMTPLRTAQAIAALGGGGGQVTQVVSLLSGTVKIMASGSSSDLSTITAVKDFSVAGVSRLILNKPTSVQYRHIMTKFLASETGGRTEVRVEFPEPNGETDLTLSLRPIAYRILQNGTEGIGSTGGAITNVSGSLVLAMTSFTAASDQRMVVII